MIRVISFLGSEESQIHEVAGREEVVVRPGDTRQDHGMGGGKVENYLTGYSPADYYNSFPEPPKGKLPQVQLMCQAIKVLQLSPKGAPGDAQYVGQG